MYKSLIPVVLIALIATAMLTSSQWRSEPYRISGYVEADEIRVGSRVGGRVAQVMVQEGETVQGKGKLLVALEPFDLRERLAEAEATLSMRQAELDRLKKGFRQEEIYQAEAEVRRLAANFEKLKKGPRKQEIAAARAQLDVAVSQLELAEFTFRRTQDLFKRKVATQAEFDQATKTLKSAQATRIVHQENLKLLQAGTRSEDLQSAEASLQAAQAQADLMKKGFRAEEIAKAAAAVLAAKAARDAAQRGIEELSITCPIDKALVEALDLQPGDLVAPNAPVLALLDMGRLWVRAYLPQSRLDVAVGEAVTVTLDALPGEQFKAHVSFVSSEGEFTPGNVQTPEERSKQVFRIKVTIDQADPRLRPGMTADIELGE